MFDTDSVSNRFVHGSDAIRSVDAKREYPNSLRQPFDQARRATDTRRVDHQELSEWARTLVCIVGPSGVGKHTLCRRLVASRPDLFSVIGPTTTRKCTRDDIEIGRYEPVTIRAFESRRDQGEFLYARQSSNGMYGIEVARLRLVAKRRRIGLLTFRSLGAVAFKLLMPQMPVLYLWADRKELLRRLRLRRREHEREILERIHAAREEVEVNDAMIRYTKERLLGEWYRLDNSRHEPPISKSIVSKALADIESRVLIEGDVVARPVHHLFSNDARRLAEILQHPDSPNRARGLGDHLP